MTRRAGKLGLPVGISCQALSPDELSAARALKQPKGSRADFTGGSRRLEQD